jgi:hypothetical protein
MEAREIGKAPRGWQRFSAKRVTQKEVVFQMEMEAREIGRLREAGRGFFGQEAGLLNRSSSRRRWKPEKSVRPREAGRGFFGQEADLLGRPSSRRRWKPKKSVRPRETGRGFWSRGRSTGEAVFQKETEVREIGKAPGV